MNTSRDDSPVSGPAEQTVEQAEARPSLLPAFEPLSSSPSLPRPAKRKYDGSPVRLRADLKHYPTPVPTSSTSILPSSPPPRPQTRPGLQRTVSTASERVPLGTVPTLELQLSGGPVLLGRSSNSSQYQLSANRLISRVHVRVSYKPPTEQQEIGKIFIECLGWNGLRIHCKGQAHELAKGDTFSSDKPEAEIMLDVQDARVLIRWPAVLRKESLSALSDATWDLQDSPSRRTPPAEPIASSPPLAQQVHLQSPVSPSPHARPNLTASSTFLGLPSNNSSSPPPPVQVYEDQPSGDEAALPEPSSTPKAAEASSSKAALSSSSLSSLDDDISDRDEENDPIVHSFGPFGDNLLPRMASFRAVSPERRKAPLHASVSPRQPQEPPVDSERATTLKSKLPLGVDISPVRNHVINQLAFSRLHSVPLSTIMNNLPVSLKSAKKGVSANTDAHKDGELRDLNYADLKQLLDETACVGEIAREGKDAAGKPLEDEFYYVPEMDGDEMRRDAVQGSLGKSSLRAVRKQHKQYYWKRPRN